MKQMVKWGVVALALCAALLAALEVLRGGAGGGGAEGARRIELTSASPDPRLALAVALLDERGDVVCSGVSLGARWVVTAAHCLRGAPTHAQAAYAARAVRLAALYPHPRFSFRAGAAWAVRHVRALHNDVGLCAAREALQAAAPGLAPHRVSPIAPYRPLYALGHHALRDLIGKDLAMVGFSQRTWSTEAWGAGAAAEITVSGYTGAVCGARGPWATPGAGAARDGRGPRGAQWRDCVCARATRPLCRGESGGGLFLGNQLVAVASLGPLNCSRPALSVFTLISPFIKSINMTITRRSLRYQEKDQLYFDLAYQTTTVHPYVKIIRTKYTGLDYGLEEKIVEKFDKLPEDAHTKIVNRSISAAIASAPIDEVEALTRVRPAGGAEYSPENRTHAAAAHYDTSDIYVASSIQDSYLD